jgi:hypothetical protein
MSDQKSAMSQLQYVDQQRPAPVKQTVHSDFLRTGRIDRSRPNWAPDEKRYLSYEEVAARTGKILTAAGEKTHERLNAFHRSIQFPKLLFHRTLTGTPHLGYCHVTAAKSKFAEYADVNWAFYIANFFADIASDDLENNTGKKLVLDKKVRGNGILFRTNDPKTALKNVLLLGAKQEALRKVIRAM